MNFFGLDKNQLTRKESDKPSAKKLHTSKSYALRTSQSMGRALHLKQDFAVATTIAVKTPQSCTVLT